MTFTSKFFLMAQHFMILRFNLFDLRDDMDRWLFSPSLSLLSMSPFQQRVLKSFPGPSYLCSKDEVVWLWQSLVNWYIGLKILSCNVSIPLALRLIGRDGVFSILCRSCEFACQKRVLKMFPVPAYLCSEDGEVWLWNSLVRLHI